MELFKHKADFPENQQENDAVAIWNAIVLSKVINSKTINKNISRMK